jgi:hypothetical protein
MDHTWTTQDNRGRKATAYPRKTGGGGGEREREREKESDRDEKRIDSARGAHRSIGDPRWTRTAQLGDGAPYCDAVTKERT